MWDPRKPHVVLFKQVVHFGLQDLPRWHPSIHKHRSAPARWEEGRGDPSDTTRLMVYWRDGVSYVRMLAGKHAEGLRVRAPGLASGGCHPGLESSGKEKSWPKKAYSSKEGTTCPDAGHSLHIYKMGIPLFFHSLAECKNRQVNTNGNRRETGTPRGHEGLCISTWAFLSYPGLARPSALSSELEAPILQYARCLT